MTIRDGAEHDRDLEPASREEKLTVVDSYDEIPEEMAAVRNKNTSSKLLSCKLPGWSNCPIDQIIRRKIAMAAFERYARHYGL